MIKKTLLLLVMATIISPLFAQDGTLPPGLYARFTTQRGNMLFQLNYERLPRTVANFIALAEGKMESEGVSSPYYSNQKIFREIEGYALFLGDPSGTGDGGVDYTVPRERGALLSTGTPGSLVAVSRQGEDHGSQIMIMINGDPFLDRKYTAFGQLQLGEKTLTKLRRGDTVLSVDIIRVGSKAQSFQSDEQTVTNMINEARQEALAAFMSEYPEVAIVLDELGDIQKSETGIFYKVLKEGSGNRPRPGSVVRVHYSGRLLNGQEFDSSYRRGEPFQFEIGRDGVIPGWIETALSMQIGEQRTVVLPPELAYGESGYGPIPPQSWLVFDIELIDFQ